MTTTWIRLSLYGGDETTKSFLIPTLNISTYSVSPTPLPSKNRRKKPFMFPNSDPELLNRT